MSEHEIEQRAEREATRLYPGEEKVWEEARFCFVQGAVWQHRLTNLMKQK